MRLSGGRAIASGGSGRGREWEGRGGESQEEEWKREGKEKDRPALNLVESFNLRDRNKDNNSFLSTPTFTNKKSSASLSLPLVASISLTSCPSTTSHEKPKKKKEKKPQKKTNLTSTSLAALICKGLNSALRSATCSKSTRAWATRSSVASGAVLGALAVRRILDAAVDWRGGGRARRDKRRRG